MPQIVVNDTLVNYKDSGGKQPVLICVHGWKHDASSFDKLTAELGSEFRIISLDLPNFGSSQINESIFTIEVYGKFLNDFINKLGIKDYVLIGHSMGGQIIIDAISKNILNPSKIILIASAGIRNDKKLRKNTLKFASKIVGPITPKKIKNKIYQKIGSDYNTDLSDIHKKIIKQTLSTDISSRAKQITTPTLLIYGSSDTYTPSWMGKKLNELLTESKFEIIENEDHWVHQTAPQKTASKIKEFLIK